MAVSDYRVLDGAEVTRTVEEVRDRIVGRWSADRGLAKVADDLAQLSRQVDADTDASAHRVRAVRWGARVVGVVILALAVLALVLAAQDVARGSATHATDWLPLLESTINNLVYAAIAVLFLWWLPDRVARRTLLALLHRMRSTAHVIDMHQLRKRIPGPDEPGVPMLTTEELRDYYQFCTKLLSLVGKTAALCAEHSADQTVLATVQSIETLTTEMSVKIWEKIGVLDRGLRAD